MRQTFSSGAPWEDVIGYARAVRIGPFVWVAGTTATIDGEVAGVGDPYEQTKVAFAIALDAVRRAGLDVADVVRTRMFLTDIDHQIEVGCAHLELFGQVRPASTMVQIAALAHPEQLIEVEIDAYRA